MKNYVSVAVSFDVNGNMKPLYITWKDGKQFEIDKIIDVRKCASLKSGGTGTRYTVQILGQRKYLFYELGKWFVE